MLKKFVCMLTSVSVFALAAAGVASAAEKASYETLFDSPTSYWREYTGQDFKSTGIWYGLGGDYTFSDGTKGVYTAQIEDEENHDDMKYRLYLRKPLTYNGKTSDAAAIGYNGIYDKETDTQSQSSNKPYIRYNASSTDISAPETNTSLTVEWLMRCDNDGGAYLGLREKYIDKTNNEDGENYNSKLLRFTSDKKITVNDTEVGAWEKGRTYKAAIEFKVGTPYANVYIDGELAAENTNAIWGHKFKGITIMDLYANFDDVKTENPDELVWFDNIRFIKSTPAVKNYESLMDESGSDWRTYAGADSTWYTFSGGEGRSFNDGAENIYSTTISNTDKQKQMKYRVYFEKPLTYNGKTSNSAAIGYNALYDTEANAESTSSNKPYIRHSFSAVDDTVIEMIIRCDNDGGANIGIKPKYTDKDSGEEKDTYNSSFFAFSKDGKITVNGTGVGVWTKGTAYKVAFEYKMGTPYANVYVDGKLVAKDTNSIWGHTLNGITLVDLRADYSEIPAKSADELVWFDDFRVYTGTYPSIAAVGTDVTVSEENNLVLAKSAMTADELKNAVEYNGKLMCLNRNMEEKQDSDNVETGDFIAASDGVFTRIYTVRAAEAEVTSVSDITYTCNGEVCDNDTFKAGTLTAGVDVKIADTPQNVALIVAEYDNGKLIQTKINEENVTNSKRVEVTADISDENHTVKIMAWNSMLGAVPLKNVKSLRNDRINVYIASDSIAADYSDSWYPQGGWGMYLGDFMNDDVYIANKAVQGTTASSFYNKYWSDIKDNLGKGDYVIVSFMHNDIFANMRDEQSEAEYIEYLEKYADEAREKGAEVIYVTGFNRGETEDTHRRTINGTYYDYVASMKTAANEKSAVCLDLHEKIMDYITAASENGTLEDVKGEIYLYNLIENGWLEYDYQLKLHNNGNLRKYGEDLTHLNMNGAKKAAGWITELMKNSQTPLGGFVK